MDGFNVILGNFDNILGINNIGGHIGWFRKSNVFAGATNLEHLNTLIDGPGGDILETGEVIGGLNLKPNVFVSVSGLGNDLVHLRPIVLALVAFNGGPAVASR